MQKIEYLNLVRDRFTFKLLTLVMIFPLSNGRKQILLFIIQSRTPKKFSLQENGKIQMEDSNNDLSIKLPHAVNTFSEDHFASWFTYHFFRPNIFKFRL